MCQRMWDKDATKWTDMIAETKLSNGERAGLMLPYSKKKTDEH
mgnify:CR=1 FL=1